MVATAPAGPKAAAQRERRTGTIVLTEARHPRAQTPPAGFLGATAMAKRTVWWSGALFQGRAIMPGEKKVSQD